MHYVHVGDFVFPVIVTRTKAGSYVAASEDWQEYGEAQTPVDALQELSRRVTYRVRNAMERDSKHKPDTTPGVSIVARNTTY